MAAGVAEPGDWSRARGDVTAFLRLTLQRWVDVGFGKLPRHDGLWIAFVQSVTDLYSYADPDLEHPDVFYVAIGCGFGSGEGVMLGDCIRLLDTEDPRLASTFHDLFHRAVSVLCCYSWRDVDWLAEHEFIAQAEDSDDAPKNQADWDALYSRARAAMHDYIPASLATRPYSTQQLQRRLPMIGRARLRALMVSVLELHGAARELGRPPKLPDGVWELDGWGEPLPAYWLCVDEHDALWGLYDGLFQHHAQMGEDPLPSLMLELDPKRPATLRRARRYVEGLARLVGLTHQLIRRFPATADPRALSNVLETMTATAAVAQS